MRDWFDRFFLVGCPVLAAGAFLLEEPGFFGYVAMAFAACQSLRITRLYRKLGIEEDE